MPSDLFDLNGRVALVTGAGRGLGRAVALGLARHGAHVVVTSRTLSQIGELADEIGRAGGQAIAIRTDVSQKTDVERMVTETVARWQRIDILFNNAGVDYNVPAIEYSEEEWDRILNVNLKGYFLCAQAVGRVMLRQKAGSIIMNSSIYGCVGDRAILPYAASKGGVNQLTRALAVEWAPYGVRVNAVAPGYMSVMARRPGEPMPTESLERNVRDSTPLGRRGRPEELVGPVVFLASDASSYVTGAIIMVDGGWSAR